MPATIQELETEARRAFAFLETDFGCRLEHAEHEPWWRRLIYRSNTGRAEIYLDERDEIVSVYFGASGEEPIPLWAVLDVRGESPPPDTDVSAWADALRRHGAEGLRGDMSAYTGLEEAYARRSKATQERLDSHMEELRRRREAEGPLRRALRRLWGRIP